MKLLLSLCIEAAIYAATFALTLPIYFIYRLTGISQTAIESPASNALIDAAESARSVTGFARMIIDS